MNLRRAVTTLFSAVPQLWLGWTLYGVLRDPLAEAHRSWATDAWILMVMEFFLVHAGFMSLAVVLTREPRLRAGLFLGLAAFYVLFLMAFWFGSDGSPIVIGAAALLAGRLVDSLGGGEHGFGERTFVSVSGVLLYLGGAFASALPENFPPFGFTPNVMAELRPAFGDMGGLWFDDPQRVVAFGAAYFVANGLLDLGRGFHAALYRRA